MALIERRIRTVRGSKFHLNMLASATSHAFELLPTFASFLWPLAVVSSAVFAAVDKNGRGPQVSSQKGFAVVFWDVLTEASKTAYAFYSRLYLKH